jgi:hypothetical protein
MDPLQNNPNDPRTPGPPMHPAEAARLRDNPLAQNERWSVPVPDTSIPMRPVGSSPFGDPNGMAPSMVPSFLKDVLSGSWIINVIFVALLWQVWVCLYPFSALAAGITFALVTPLLRTVLPPTTVILPGLLPVIGGVLAGLVAGWNACRFEEKLEKIALYRVVRHLVRLPVIAMSTAMALQKTEGFPYDPSLGGVAQVLRVPLNLAVVGGVVIASHFLLWHWKWGREFWHHRLSAACLRKRGIQAVY